MMTQALETLAAIAVLLADTLGHAESRRCPMDLAWLTTLAEADLSALFREYGAAVARATSARESHACQTAEAVLERRRLAAQAAGDKTEKREASARIAPQSERQSHTLPPATNTQTSWPPRVRTARRPSPDDLGAYDILDTAWTILKEHHGGDLLLTREAWRSHNKAAALQIYKAGKTPEEVAWALRIALTHPNSLYKGISTLTKLIDALPNIRLIHNGQLGFTGRSQRPRTIAGDIR